MNRHFATGALVVGGLLGAIPACMEPIQQDLGLGWAGQDTQRYVLHPVGTEVIVLVVDDADTPEAAELRARMALVVKAGLESAFENWYWGSCASDDPAEWHPADLRVVLARPSAPDDEALLTEVGSPDLAWVTPMADLSQTSPVVAATEAGLSQRLAKPGEAHRPLRAARRAVRLLSGAETPATAEEEAFVGSLASAPGVRVVVAVTRDDEDAGPPEDLVVPSDAGIPVARVSIVTPFQDRDSGCGVSPGLATTRIGRWAKEMDATSFTFPCDGGAASVDGALSHCCTDCNGPGLCRGRELAVDEEGRAVCRIFVEQPDLTQCDASRGWRDPDGEAEIVEHDGVSYRRCEIVQLEGAALESCRTDIECKECSPGYCVTEVEDLVPASCGSQHPWPLRFIGGAREGTRGFFEISCATK